MFFFLLNVRLGIEIQSNSIFIFTPPHPGDEKGQYNELTTCHGYGYFVNFITTRH